MAGRGMKALYVFAVLASGLSLSAASAQDGARAQNEPVSGYAGMGTADPAPASGGDGAPPHLLGEAPSPGDAAGKQEKSGSGDLASDKTPVPDPKPAEIAPPQQATAPEPAAPAAAAEAKPDTTVPVVVELPSAPAAPTGLDAPAPQKAEAPTPPNTNAGTSAPKVDAPKTQAAEQAPPADPLAPISGAIAKMVAAPPVPAGKEQEAIAAFYGARSNAPAFVDLNGYNARGKAIIARFTAAGDDGLEPNDYKVQKLVPGADADTLAQAELRLAASALLYARHAQAGRFDPSRLSPLLTPTRSFPDALAVLNTLATAPDAGAALAAYNPTHPGYVALKAKLADARKGTSARALPRIPPGPTLKPGDVDARVPALRERLGLKPDKSLKNDRLYDIALLNAVLAFQGTSGMEPDGRVGAGTVEALNSVATPADRTADIIANMERWRWLPRDLGTTNVMVNIPEYMVRINDNGRMIHETRVVVGKPDTATPLLSHDMEYIVVNPSWNIPVSIARKEMLPNLQRDPYYLQRQGIQIERNGRAIDPGVVNWNAGLGGYSFRQPPGERNALGRIKFMFPNQHSVYLHDTPSRSLFANEKRAFSHGCIRVQDPLSFGEVIFNLGLPNDGWTEAKIGKMFGGQERYINLKRHIPVHLVYFTALVDGSGRLTMRQDIYGIDEKVKEQLGLAGPQHMASSKPKTATR
ncbi:L,D-transpeptidase family protein [Aquabacter sp. CN5-332]|uniref:L,D-transpeptidase family protein n=1 Tax=Aquabacter sp. CN5-332 TaxID=3156608 RepID=UPI0032B52AF3